MSIIEVAVKRPVTVWMFTLAILLFGMVSLSRLSLNLLPELSYPTLTIRTDYVGAAPGEVEQLVTMPIEEAVGVVKGVRKVVSSSKAEQSDVVLEFEWGTEMDIASLEVREKLDVLFLPLDVKRPLLLRFNPSLDPVLRYGLSIESLSTEQSANVLDDAAVLALKRGRTYAEEEIKRKLESVDGVASVKIGGGLENEIQVLIDQQKIAQFNISVESVIQRLRDENVNASGGRIEDGSQEYLVRTINQFDTIDDMRQLYIANRNGRYITLNDIASVIDTYKERDSVTRFNGVEGVEIAIYKEGDANTVRVAHAVEQRLQSIKNELPDGYLLTEVYNQSNFISSAIDQVKSAAVVGGVLAMFVLYFFLKNIWPTLIISISIPVSIIATFNLMYSYDISLNIMSLGGIALAIGLLVDNSIVVLENIDRHKQKSINTQQAAAKGTSEVSMAIVASTLTTMAVFFPLVFVEGIAGQLFSDQALTVTFALAVSLVVALTLIPMLAAREKSDTEKQTYDLGPHSSKWEPQTLWSKILFYITWPVRALFYFVFNMLPTGLVSIFRVLFRGVSLVLAFIFKPFLWVFERVYSLLASAYSSVLNVAMKARILVAVLVFGISSLAVMLLPSLGMELIPSMSQGEFNVEVSLPSGTSLATSDRIVKDLANYTEQQVGVDRTYSLAGTGSLVNASPAQGGDHWAKLNVVMTPSASQQDLLDAQRAMRNYLNNIPGVESELGAPELFSFATPLEIHISGYNLDQLKRYGNELAELLAENDRFVDVTSSLQSGNPELKIEFDHAKLAQLGLTAPQVSELIAAKIGGKVASKFSIDDRKVDILVLNEQQQRDSIDDIVNLMINVNAQTPQNGQAATTDSAALPSIPLSAVADVRMAVGPSEISRSDQQRVVIISANLAYGDLGAAVAEAQTILDDFQLPLNLQAKVSGQSEEMDNSFSSLMFALGLAIFMVYIVMASQFESLLHPLLILFTVPLACAGSIYGLVVTGTNVSVVVFIGLIMLAGIVVNNAIVLIDRINQLRAEGLQKHEAIVEAASNRLRPIMMTTTTTVLGLLPMAIGFGDGAEIRTPMAITVIFGLLYASVLTLVLIPVLYSLFDVKRFAKAENAKIEHSSIAKDITEELSHG